MRGRRGWGSTRFNSCPRLTLRLRHQSQVGTGGFWPLLPVLLPGLTLTFVWGPIGPRVGVVSEAGAANESINQSTWSGGGGLQTQLLDDGTTVRCMWGVVASGSSHPPVNGCRSPELIS
jgi:hypothetical protein